MILELDCGNSFIKWRVLESSDASVRAEGIAGSDIALIDSLVALPGLLLTRCRLVSVRALEETDKLIAALVGAFGVAVSCATSAREMSGVRNGYEDFQRLGMDRWLAMLGAFKLASGACLVLDFGTAATADFIGPDGEHLGGLFARVCRLCVINCEPILARYVMTTRPLSGRWSVSLQVARP